MQRARRPTAFGLPAGLSERGPPARLPAGLSECRPMVEHRDSHPGQTGPSGSGALRRRSFVPLHWYPRPMAARGRGDDDLGGRRSNGPGHTRGVDNRATRHRCPRSSGAVDSTAAEDAGCAATGRVTGTPGRRAGRQGRRPPRLPGSAALAPPTPPPRPAPPSRHASPDRRPLRRDPPHTPARMPAPRPGLSPTVRPRTPASPAARGAGSPSRPCRHGSRAHVPPAHGPG